MQQVEASRAGLAFRMDDRKQRLLVNAGSGSSASFYGWEVQDAAALAALAARLEAAGVAVAHGSRALADERRVRELIVFADPIGNRLEAFHGAEVAGEPFRPGRTISGFRTGPLGMGHTVLTVERLDDVIPFYRDVLGFRLSDYILKPFKAYFFHLNPRHHSLAFLETGKNGIHHMMVELFSLDDVGQAYDIALMDPESIGSTLRAPHQRLHDVVLFVVAVRIHGRVRLGWTAHRPGELDGRGIRDRPEPVGPRPRVAACGEARGGARDADETCAGRAAPARAGDRGQSSAHARRVPVVGSGGRRAGPGRNRAPHSRIGCCADRPTAIFRCARCPPWRPARPSSRCLDFGPFASRARPDWGMVKWYHSRL